MRVLRLIVLLGGCLTTTAAPAVDTVDIASLRAENKGVVLAHSSLHDGACYVLWFRLAQRGAAGLYVANEWTLIKKFFPRLPNEPSQTILPAGTYGIVGVQCRVAGRDQYYHAQAIERGNILTGRGDTYEKPIALFTVKAGEVVDIGSLRIASRPLPGVRLVGPRFEFAAAVAPIPEALLQTGAAINPNLYRARIKRPMTIPGQARQP